MSARREEALVHRVVELSFESLRKDRVCACLPAKKKAAKKKGKEALRVMTCPEFPVRRFHEFARIWKDAAAKRNQASSSGKGASDADVIVISSDDEEVA